MSIWGIVLIVLLGLLCVYEIVSFGLTIYRRKKAKNMPEEDVNNVIKNDFSEEENTEEK